jgi:hypothetical protein
MTPQPTDWQNIAEQASKENDTQSLLSLVAELNRLLEQNERTSVLLENPPTA